MHSYVKSLKNTAKKIDIQPSAVISPNKPDPRVLSPRHTNQTDQRVALQEAQVGMEEEEGEEEETV